MQNIFFLSNKICNFIIRRTHKYIDNRIARSIVAKVLQIDRRRIDSLNIGNRCINIFSDRYLYKCQLYGDSIKRDLMNRKIFSVYQQSGMISPIKVYKKKPLTIIMPILKQSDDHDEAACYILDKLKGVSLETAFRIEDYPLIMDGLRLLGKCKSGVTLGKKMFEYLKGQQGSIVRVGIVHGDFHRDNIMYKGNQPVLIDFDCSRKDDIQAVDALYYILEEVRRSNEYNNPLLEDWLLLYSNVDMMYEYRCVEQIDIDFRFGLIIFFLERISQEQRYNCLFMDEQEKSIKKISHMIKFEK